MIKVRWKTDLKKLAAKERQVDKNADNAAREVAEAFKREVQAGWYPTSPSPEGGPPAKLTGNLDSSIFVSKQGRDPGGRFAGKDAQVWFVEINTAKGDNPLGRGNYEYVLDDEAMMNRPFVDRAADIVNKSQNFFYRKVFG